MRLSLANQTAVVTGAGRGIGREIALRFASEGARVVVADLDRDGARRVATEISETGSESHAVPMDITDPSQVESLIQETVERFGQLDVFVNNAGVGLNRPFLETSLEEWQRTIAVNLTGTFLCAQAAARVMVSQGSGRIVNIASISGQRGGQGRAAYDASKAGVILLTKVMAVELGAKGVCVSAVAPGPVVTDMSRRTHTEKTRTAYHQRIPLERYGTESEIAAAVVFLASREASFVNGHILNTDGGFGAAGLMFPPEPEASE